MITAEQHEKMSRDEAKHRVELKHLLRSKGIPFDNEEETEDLEKKVSEVKTMLETQNKADPKYDWRPVVKQLAEEYRQIYGDIIDQDSLIEFLREKNEEESLVGFEEWDWGQAVTEQIMKDIEAEGGEIQNVVDSIHVKIEPTDEQKKFGVPEGTKDGKTKPKLNPEDVMNPKKKKKRKDKVIVEQGHLEFSCHKTLLRNFSKKLQVADHEVKIIADEKGLSCRVVEPAHVLMAEVFVPSDEFYTGSNVINKSIHYKIDKPLEFGLDLDKLDAVLRLLDWSTDTLHCTVNESEMILETVNEKPLRKRIGLLDTCGMMESKVPKLEFTLEAEVERSELAVLQKATSKKKEDEAGQCGGDKVELKNEGKYLKAIIPDVDEDELTITLSKNIKGTGRSLYSPDYINNILSALTENRTVKLQWAVDCPIQITGRLQDKGTYMYLLAPRIETEE